MKLQMAVACDAATEYDGRLSLLGTFDTLETTTFPLVKPQCAVAVQIVWNRSEEGRHRTRVDFMDDDGNPTLRELESIVDVCFDPGCSFVSTNHVINIQQLTFNKEGTYQVNVAVDNHHLGSAQIQVVISE